MSRTRLACWLLVALASSFVASALLLAAARRIDLPSFAVGFESGLLAEDWQIDADPACELAVSSSQAREGSLALRIRAPRDLRCEVVPRIAPRYLERLVREPVERDRTYAFSVLVDDLGEARPPQGLEENTIVAQWHASPDPIWDGQGRGPPLALRIQDGNWAITYGWDASLRSAEDYVASSWHWLGPVEIGRWTDWTFRVRWSYGNDGMTEVLRDGKTVMKRSGPNAYNDLRGVYLKLGVYHPTGDATVFLDGISIADAND